MRLLVAVTIALLFAISPVSAGEPNITADSAILIDQQTGQILYSKSAMEKRAIASTTKILTSIIAIEEGDLQEIVTVSPKAASIDESTIYLEPEEKLSLESLLYGALMRSGNDACVAIAEHISGEEKKFIELMNKKAILLGAKNSNFENTNGLPNENHYSTAYDLALIAKHTLNNEIFREIVGTKYKTIKNAGDMKKERFLKNTNKLLWQYLGTTGVKTGTTDKAGKCLIASATKGDRSLIAVVLHSDQREEDAKNLLEFGFNNFVNLKLLKKDEIFSKVTIEKGPESTVKVKASEDLIVTVPKEERYEKKLALKHHITAPIVKGEKLGSFTVLIDGKEIKSVKLISEKDVYRLSKFEELKDFLKDFR